MLISGTLSIASKDEVRKEIKKIQMPIEVLEGLFTCPKCQCKQTHHYAVQLRSADEPMTVFIHCLNKFCKYMLMSEILFIINYF